MSSTRSSSRKRKLGKENGNGEDGLMASRLAKPKTKVPAWKRLASGTTSSTSAKRKKSSRSSSSPPAVSTRSRSRLTPREEPARPKKKRKTSTGSAGKAEKPPKAKKAKCVEGVEIHSKKQIKERCADFEKVTSILKEKVATADTHIADMQEQLERAKEELGSTQVSSKRFAADVEEKELELDSMRRKNKMLAAQVEEMEDAWARTKRELKTSKSTVVDLEGDLDTLRSQHKQARSRLTALQDDVDRLEGECAQQRSKVARLNTDLGVAREQVSEAESEVSRQKAASAALATQLEESRGEVAQLIGKNSEQRAQITSLQTSVSAANERVTMVTTQNNTLQRSVDDLTGTLAARDATIAQLEADVATRMARIAELERKAHEEEVMRRKLHNTIQELKGNIRVFARLRPAAPRKGEEDPFANGTYAFPAGCDKKEVQLTAGGTQSVTGGTTAGRQWAFGFDRVFDPTTRQEDVFVEVSDLVQSCLDGYNVTIFAYGQTGSGKTYTMEGPSTSEDDANRGMIPRSVEQIFASIGEYEAKGWKYSMTVEFVEIYNEHLRDLIAKKGADAKVEIRMDARSKKTTLQGQNMVGVKAAKEVYKVLRKANAARSTARTSMNEQSSRSHSVFTLRIKGTHEGTKQRMKGILNLVDLAGSERLEKSQATGQQLKETQHINKSLAALGNVICSLNANKDGHIPFRNSKLTHMLQESLSGDAKVLMIACLAPEVSNVDESLCTLRFASKVNNTQVGTAKRKVKS